MENNRLELRQAAISVGKKLREAREKKSLAIDQIQKTTKIHSTVLIALEEGLASEILTDTYVRSFLKKYAHVLGLPAVELLKEYFPPHAEQSSANINFHEHALPKETLLPPTVLYATGILIVSLAAILILVFVGTKISAALKRSQTTSQQKTSTTAVAKKKASKVVTSTPKKKTVSKNKVESKDLVPKTVPLSLLIRVKEPVLVKLKRDGILIFDTVMTKGLAETIVADSNIELEIGKSSALELALNGRPILLPARNNIFTLVITRKGVRIK